MNKVPIWGLLYRNGKGVGREIGETAVLRSNGTSVGCKSGGWAIQTSRPKHSWYFEPLHFTSPIAGITTAPDARVWFGQKVWMWSGGYSPNVDHDREGTIVKFEPGSGYVYELQDDPWKVKMEIPVRNLDDVYHAQALDPLKSWFIIPASVFEEPTTAGLFNRIFLGR